MRAGTAAVEHDPEAVAGLRSAGIDFMLKHLVDADGRLARAKAIRFLSDTRVRVCCEGLIGGVWCWRETEMALDDLGLPDGAVFVHIPRLRRFRCRRCGGRKVRVLPSWPAVRGPMGEPEDADPRLLIPGVTPEARLPGTEPLPRGPG